MDEKDFEFKDKEIEKITTDLVKANKREFGKSFNSAIVDNQSNQTQKQNTSDAKQGHDSELSRSVPEIEIVTKENSAEQKQQNLEPNEIVKQSSTRTEKDQKEFYSVVKPLQTYERDMAEQIRSHNETVASINLSRQKQKIQSGEMAHATEKVAGKSLTLLISMLLIIAGTSTIMILYFFFLARPPKVIPVKPSIVATNETRVIDISGKEYGLILADIKRLLTEPGKAGDLVRIEIKQGVAENKKVISAEKFFEIFAPDAPAPLGRAFGEQWILGFLGVNDKRNEPFIFVNISSFENAFNGMLAWENNMVKNIGSIFIEENILSTNLQIEVATRFEDMIIRSKDVRAIKDSLGNIVMLYSFLEPKILVITTNEQTFVEVLGRFFSSQLVR